MPRVLIIDDENAIRFVLEKALSKLGMDVRTAGSGAQGIKLNQQCPADIVITDIIMPGLDGVETIKVIRQQFPETKFIAISGGGGVNVKDYQPGAISTSAYLVAAKEAGADKILTKPFNKKDLIDAINALEQS
jgi:CheY-like chemotaxis protein